MTNRFVLWFACAAACSAPPRPTAHPPASGVAWRYQVVASEDLAELAIEATFATEFSNELGVNEDASQYVSHVEWEEHGHWQSVKKNGLSWVAPCKGCTRHVRYRFLLKDAAAALDDSDVALVEGNAILAPPSTWLIHPLHASSGPRFWFHVTTTPPVQFVTGVDTALDHSPNAYEADIGDLEQASYAAFGTLREHPIAVGNAIVNVSILPGTLPVDDAAITRWIQTDSVAIQSYYGRFPINHVLILVAPGNGGTTFGTTYGGGGASVLLRVGGEVSAETINDDWVVTHELLHVGFPSLSRDHVWFTEGVATYIEPIVRARSGLLKPEKFWRDLVDGLPHGLPETGDQGLELTHTWGRTYWGGALFCLAADLTIRERTQNQRSLDDALRAIMVQGGNVKTHWSMDHMLDEGDRATGTHVLHDLYKSMALAPTRVSLHDLWKRLGVETSGNNLTFDDQAPLAAIRRSITEPTRRAKP